MQLNQLPLLHGNQVKLTRFRDEDAATVASWYEEDQFLRLLDADAAYPKDETQLRKWFAEEVPPARYLFAVRHRGDDRLLGYVELSGLLWNQRCAWVAIAIGETSNRRKGFGAEALRLLLQFAFFELNLERVQLTVFEYNESAIRLYERSGFQREGTYREFLRRDGRTYDMFLYGLLRREWEHHP